MTAVFEPASCRVCKTYSLHSLPIPHPRQSMVSDGRIRLTPLSKVSCISCGLVSHRVPLSESDVRGVYDFEYDLGTSRDAGDSQRALRYASVIAELGNMKCAGNILEIGCGSGAVLSELAQRWSLGRFLGIEAAPQLALGRGGSRVEIRQGFLEDLRDEDRQFDLVYAINVVEHAADPTLFLGAIAGLLAKEGVVIVICPDGGRPNLELLFADHINSFTARSLNLIAAKAGLRIVYEEKVSRFDDFQIVVLALADKVEPAHFDENNDSFHQLHDRRTEYLQQWAMLDGHLLAKIDGANQIYAFGAGETAALLRAYAPETWKRVSALIVDEPASAHRLEKKILRYSDLKPRQRMTILLATHPQSQPLLCARLESQCFKAVRWDSEIGR